MEPHLVDTQQAIKDLISTLPHHDHGVPSLYLDIEGQNLFRHGTISLLTVLHEAQQKVYLVDVTVLKESAFSTAASDGRTLRSILESDNVTKVFFDIRNDSSALFGLFGINVRGIEDLQLLELATRSFDKRCVNGLAKCIDRDAGLGWIERQTWVTVKDRGRKLFLPELGGSYAVFDARPLSDELKRYCAQDVTLMPTLRRVYCRKLCDAWWRKIEQETLARIALSQRPDYDPKGSYKTLGPTSWIGWYPAPSERGPLGEYKPYLTSISLLIHSLLSGIASRTDDHESYDATTTVVASSPHKTATDTVQDAYLSSGKVNVCCRVVIKLIGTRRAINIPFPTQRLAQIALRTLAVDEELSPLVQRSFSLTATPALQGGNNAVEKTVLTTEYKATTDRMLRVAVNGFFDNLGVIVQIMEELDMDVLHEKGLQDLEGAQAHLATTTPGLSTASYSLWLSIFSPSADPLTLHQA
nr:ekc/keops complex subunit pcc1 [Quercus suber]